MKSERLKKLENELNDLIQWKDLGLVPKKDLEKHEQEIELLSNKINEEQDRLRYLKETGEVEEYTMPKRSPQAKQPFQDTHTMPDIEADEAELTNAGLDMDSGSYSDSTSLFDVDEGSEERTSSDEEEENPFSDRNRWKRGILEDPDSNDW
ncbi:MAG: hypothetical protein MRY21_08240 [Simkaniaceae bacterium]|nr:hypothetical protein [Simkaniaceae bacterium]